MKQYCERCTTEMRELSYCHFTDYDEYRYVSSVYDNLMHDCIGKLIYCPNCGSIRVNLNETKGE